MNGCRQLLIDDFQGCPWLLGSHEELPRLIRLLVDLTVVCDRLKQLLPGSSIRHKLLDGAA
jgi:hypothetical protein